MRVPRGHKIKRISTMDGIYHNVVEVDDTYQPLFDMFEGVTIPRWTAQLAIKELEKGFIGGRQRQAVLELMRGEEGSFFCEKMVEMWGIVQRMPHTRQQSHLGDDAIIYLHYFIGSCDWWITEKDVGSKDDQPGEEQWQAFGYACLGDPMNAECGYICLPEITKCNAELDFHWKPITLRQLKESQ